MGTFVSTIIKTLWFKSICKFTLEYLPFWERRHISTGCSSLQAEFLTRSWFQVTTEGLRTGRRCSLQTAIIWLNFTHFFECDFFELSYMFSLESPIFNIFSIMAHKLTFCGTQKIYVFAHLKKNK